MPLMLEPYPPRSLHLTRHFGAARASVTTSVALSRALLFLAVLGSALALTACEQPSDGASVAHGGATSDGGGQSGASVAGSGVSPSSGAGGDALASPGGAPSAPGGAPSVQGGAGGNVSNGSGGAGGDRAASGGGGAAASAGASNGGSSGAVSACSGLVCDDFESGQVDANRWDSVTKGGTLVVQQQRVAHGKYAAQLHGQAGASDDWALLVAKAVPAALKGSSTFGRVYLYYVPEAAASIHIQLAFAGRSGTGAADGPAPLSKLRYLEVASTSGRWQQGFDLLDVSPLVEEVSYSNNSLPTNRWACLEWQFEDQPDRVTVWIDSAQKATFDNTNVSYASPGPVPKSGAPLYNGTSTNIIGGFETFGFGFHDWHPQKAFDIYYDDLVLDAKRVGCLG